MCVPINVVFIFISISISMYSFDCYWPLPYPCKLKQIPTHSSHIWYHLWFDLPFVNLHRNHQSSPEPRRWFCNPSRRRTSSVYASGEEGGLPQREWSVVFVKLLVPSLTSDLKKVCLRSWLLLKFWRCCENWELRTIAFIDLQLMSSFFFPKNWFGWWGCKSSLQFVSVCIKIKLFFIFVSL